MFRFLIIITLILNISISFSKEKEIDTLFYNLQSAEDNLAAQNFEKKIWNIWIEGSSLKENNLKMKNGILLMFSGKYNSALNIFIELTKTEPNWAEPWNKIATIRYLQGDLYGSIRDIQSTLIREPRHFGALAGLAQINLSLGLYKDALANLEQAIKIYPLISIKSMKPLLLELIKKREI